MGERRSRTCNQQVVDGACCQSFDSEVIAMVLNPPVRECSRKVYGLVSVTPSNPLRLVV